VRQCHPRALGDTIGACDGLATLQRNSNHKKQPMIGDVRTTREQTQGRSGQLYLSAYLDGIFLLSATS